MKVLIMRMIFLFALSFCNSIFSQNISIHILENRKKFDVSVLIDSGNSKQFYFSDCASSRLTRLKDSVKIRLIKELLQLRSDTSISSHPLGPLSSRYFRTKYPVSKMFRIQVQALTLINLLVFGSEVFDYSPFPVLVYSGSGSEIGNDQKAIDSVYKVYERWLELVLLVASGERRSFTYPNLKSINVNSFNSLDYHKEYYGFGTWSSYYDCGSYD